ncbi:MAG: hypothetical protein OES38_12725, partial [Gammaproteobacteria bacterium]|nr:hypothetical protein [Gammaproteobacteria bacterium]
RHSILGIRGEDDAERVLEADAGHEREKRKEAGGFVGATTAGAFLRDIAGGDLELLVDEASYDAETAEYFKRRVRPDDDVAPEPATTAEHAADIPEAELDELERELEAYEVLRSEHVALLTGPEQPEASAVLPVRRALASLADDPDCLEARSNELAYLSNVVMAQVSLGHTKNTQRLTESQAANLVMATCNLGGSYVLWADAREAEENAERSPFVDMLTEEPGLVRLFRVGWNLISHLPVQAASRLTRSLSSAEAAERLAAKPWLASEVAALVEDPSLVDVVREGGFDQAKDTLKILGIALEPAAIRALELLIDGAPRLAEALEDGGRADDPDAAPRARYIASMKDMLLLDRFLSQLHNQLRE